MPRINGELGYASFQNSASDLTPTSTGLVYFNTTSSEAKWYTGSAWVTAADTSTAQTFTNKTLTAAKLDQALFIQGSAPSTPASGNLSLFAKADKKLYTINSDGVEAPIGSGSGSGEINFVESPSDANGWAASGAGITVATTSTAGHLPLGPVVDTAIRITRVSGTDYTHYRFTMPASAKNRMLKIQWEQRPDSGYVSGDLKVDMYTNTLSNYSGTATRIPLSTDVSGVSPINNYIGKFSSNYVSDSSDYYELRIAGVSGTTPINLASVVVGPGVNAQGAVVSDFIELTPSIGDFSNATGLGISSADSFLRYRRIGNTIHIRARYLFTGTGSSSSSFRWNYAPLGSGITLDVAKSPEFAIATRFNSGEPNYGIIKFTQTTYAEFGLDGSAASARGDEFGAGAGLVAFLNFDVMIPVSEWAGNGVLQTGQNTIEYAFNTDTTDADNTTAFGYGPQGTPFPSSVAALRKKRVRFQTPIQRGESVYILVRKDLNSPWAVLTGVDTSCSVQPLMRQGTAFYGIGVDTASINATDVDINFGTYSFANDGTYFNTGNSWSTASGYWCAVKCSQAAAVGFGIATSTQRGLTFGYTEKTDAVIANVSNLGTITVLSQLLEFTRTEAGVRKLKINLMYSVSGGTTSNLFEFSIAGVVFKNTSNFSQPILASVGPTGFGQSASISAYTIPNTASVRFYTTNTPNPNSFIWSFTGEVILESDPSWA